MKNTVIDPSLRVRNEREIRSITATPNQKKRTKKNKILDKALHELSNSRCEFFWLKKLRENPKNSKFIINQNSMDTPNPKTVGRSNKILKKLQNSFFFRL